MGGGGVGGGEGVGGGWGGWGGVGGGCGKRGGEQRRGALLGGASTASGPGEPSLRTPVSQGGVPI